MMAPVDCMSCLVNVARGLAVESDLRLRWGEVVHAAVWEMGPGLVVAACKYEQTDPYGHPFGWRRRKEPA